MTAPESVALVRQKIRVKAVIHFLVFPGLGLTRVLTPHWQPSRLTSNSLHQTNNRQM